MFFVGAFFNPLSLFFAAIIAIVKNKKDQSMQKNKFK
jgi:hypothetical protein